MLCITESTGAGKVSVWSCRGWVTSPCKCFMLFNQCKIQFCMAHSPFRCVRTAGSIRQEQYEDCRPGSPTAASVLLKRNNSADSETAITPTSQGSEIVVSISARSCQDRPVYTVFSLLWCVAPCVIVMVFVFMPLLGKTVALSLLCRGRLSGDCLCYVSPCMSLETHAVQLLSVSGTELTDNLSIGTAVSDLFASWFWMKPGIGSYYTTSLRRLHLH